MSSLSAKRKGEIFALGSVIPWAFFPVLSKLSLEYVPPIMGLAISTFFAALFLGGVIAFRREWHSFSDTELWKYILIATLLNAVLYHGLLFFALRVTSAGNVAILSLTEILWTFLFFGIWKKEKHSLREYFGAFCMALGAAIVLFRGSLSLQAGDLLVIIAALTAPIANSFQQHIIRRVGAQFLLFVRSALGALLLFCFSLWLEGESIAAANTVEILPLLFVNGVLALGIAKFLFLESFRLQSVAKAVSLAAISPLFTLLYAYLILEETPTLWQIAGFFPLVFGLFLLVHE